MKKRSHYVLITSAVIAVVILLLITLRLTSGQDSVLGATFYDSNGRPISSGPLFAVVSAGGSSVQGVSYMDITVNVKNTGELPLAAVIDSATPASFSAALARTAQNIDPGQTATWTTSLIPVDQFVNTSQTFAITVKASYTYAGQTNTLSKQGSLTYAFASDPVAGLSLDLSSSVGTPSAGVVPTPDSDTTPTGYTTGTACTDNSQCASNSCVQDTYTVHGTLKPGYSTLYIYCASASETCSRQPDTNCYDNMDGNVFRGYSLGPEGMSCTAATKSCA